MSDIMQQIQALEFAKQEAEKLIEQKNLALKLYENREFRKLFVEEFFVTEPARLVAESADPSLDLQQRADALAMAQAPGHCKRWLSAKIQMAAHAERDLPEINSTIEELRALGADE